MPSDRVSAPLIAVVVAATVTTLSVLPRILALSGSTPAVLVPVSWSDVLAVWRDSSLSGHRLPYFDVGFAYPPVVGYVSGLISLVVSDARGFLIGWAIVIVAASAAGAFVLARAAASRRTLVYWSCAPQLLLFAGINFDVLAAALVAGAAVLARRGQNVGALAMAGIGTATKLYPASFAPIMVLRALRNGDRAAAVAGALGFVIAAGVLYLPATLAARSTSGFVAEYAVRKGANLDSIWALPAAVLEAGGIAADLPIVLVTIAGLIATYLLVVLPRGVRAPDPVVGFALAVLAALLWTRFYSPQYSIWLLPFFVLLPIRASSFALLSVADFGVAVGIFPLTLASRPGDALVPILLTVLAASVVLRHVALIVLLREVMSLGAREPGYSSPLVHLVKEPARR